MAFLVSPGVNVSEIDATTVVPSVSTSTGAVAGAFQWGPIDVARLVSSEDELVQVFGKPDSTTALTFFTAANFLAYSSSLFVSRADAATLNSAIALNVAANTFASNVKIRNDDHYFNSFYTATNANVAVAARYPGALGNTLKVAFCANSNAVAFSTWTYAPFFDAAPGTSPFVAAKFKSNANDEMHIAIIDEDGLITGTANTVIERYANVSKATNAKGESGQSIYWVDVLYNSSKWVYGLGQNNATWGVAANASHSFAGENINGISFVQGVDATPTDGNVQIAYQQFASSENVDISLVMTAGHSSTVAANTISLSDGRRDCVTFVSPALANVQAADPVTAITNFRNSLTSTSFAVLDSGWK